MTMAPAEIRVDTLVFCSPGVSVGEADVLMGIDEAGTDACLRAMNARGLVITAVAADAGDLTSFDDDRAISEHGAIGAEDVTAEPQRVIARLDAASFPRIRLRSPLNVALL